MAIVAFFQIKFLSSFKKISQAAIETVIENGNAEPSINGAILIRKIILPMHARLTHLPRNIIPMAMKNCPIAISGIIMWL